MTEHSLLSSIPGSAIRSTDLNDNFTQNLYVTQESNRDATQELQRLMLLQQRLTPLSATLVLL
jgi:hypothetical protein